MIFEGISSLQLWPVSDRGIPNAERIPVKVMERVDIGSYGIMAGYVSAEGLFHPYNDCLFWFGDAILNPGDWLLVYTGAGEATATDGIEPGSKVYSLHWGRGATMFANSLVVPTLFGIRSVAIGAVKNDVPQLGSG